MQIIPKREIRHGKFSLLYVNKKEADSLLQSTGHQLSGGLIPHDGFYHSIRENGSPVKSKFNTGQYRGRFGNTGDGSMSSRLRTQTQKETLPKKEVLLFVKR